MDARPMVQEWAEPTMLHLESLQLGGRHRAGSADCPRGRNILKGKLHEVAPLCRPMQTAVGAHNPLLVLDSAAILQGGTFSADSPMATVPLVAEELAGEPYFERLCAAGLQILEPTRGSIAAARSAAVDLGEGRTLSAADLQVLALAHERQALGPVVLLTDDYALQNVASSMGLPFEPIAEVGIRAVRTYGRRCRSCGRFAQRGEPEQECVICGGPMHRARQPPSPR